MGRQYTGRVAAVTVPATNAFDVFEYTAPSNAVVEIVEVVCGISGTADFGDAQAEGLDIQFLKGIGATSGSGGSTPSLVATETGDAAADGTLEASNTTVATAGGGSLPVLWDEPFNLQVGFKHIPPEPDRFRLAPSEKFVVRLPVGPSDELTTSWYASIKVREIGGG